MPTTTVDKSGGRIINGPAGLLLPGIGAGRLDIQPWARQWSNPVAPSYLQRNPTSPFQMYDTNYAVGGLMSGPDQASNWDRQMRQAPDLNTNFGAPSFYRGPIELQNMVASQAQQRMNTPVGGNLMSSLGGGLSGMYGRAGNLGGQAGLDLAGSLIGGQRNLNLAQMQRAPQYADLLSNMGQLGAATVSQYLENNAKRRMMQESYAMGRRKIKQGALGQIPILGGMLGHLS